MNRPFELNAEQIIFAIQQLPPSEKKKVRQQLPHLFDVLILPVEAPIPIAPTHQYAFAEVRYLLRDVPESLSDEIINEREERIA
jgi:hypothetical protein